MEDKVLEARIEGDCLIVDGCCPVTLSDSPILSGQAAICSHNMFIGDHEGSNHLIHMATSIAEQYFQSHEVLSAQCPECEEVCHVTPLAYVMCLVYGRFGLPMQKD